MGLNESQIKHLGKSDPNNRQNYVCGHCDTSTSGRIVSEYNGSPVVKWLICTSCSKGSVWDNQSGQIPGSKAGSILTGLPPKVNDAYEEARRCLSVNAYTACELICRNILMHIAVDKGELKGKSFEQYLNFLESTGYITPPIKPWADQIRQNGNSAAHELEKTSKERAEDTLIFTMQLLRIIYEMEYTYKKYQVANPTKK